MQIEKLFNYPVAGMSGQEVGEIRVTPETIIGNRVFVLVTVDQMNKWLRGKADGFPLKLTQAVEPRLVLFTAQDVNGELQLHFEDEQLPTGISTEVQWSDLPFVHSPEDFASTDRTLTGAVFPIRASRRSTVPRWAADCGNDVAEWISRRLGRSCRLLKSVRSFSTEVGKNHFTWYTEPHLISSASLRQLAADTDEQNLTHEPFRPNIIINGNEPFDEEFWASVVIGDDTEFLIQLCERCGYVAVDQQTAEQSHQGIVQNIFDEHGGNFGVYVAPQQPEVVLRVGDSVEVKERQVEKQPV